MMKAVEKAMTRMRVDRSKEVLFLGSLIAATTLVVFRFHRQSKRKKSRTWSCTSLGMIRGVFPDHVHFPEPIFNVAIYFSGDCPPVQDLADAVVQPLLEFARLAEIPDLQGSSRTTVVQATDMIREVQVCGSEDETNDVIFNHLQDSLTQQRPHKPWWEILRVHNTGKGRSACVLRIHHALADGVSLAHVFSQIITDPDGNHVQLLDIQRRHPPPTRPLLSCLGSILQETAHLVTLPLSRFDDRIMFFKNVRPKYSGRRACVVFPAMDLSLVKQLKSAAGVTINDILMTVVSQVIHDYCASQNCPVLAAKRDLVQCRALLPVSLPRPPQEMLDKSTALRNKFCPVSIDLCVGCEDILERLACIHERTSAIKSSPRVGLGLFLQNSLPHILPTRFQQETVLDIFRRHSLLFSNMPGPQQFCQLAGKTADSVQVYGCNLTPQVGLVSYGGKIFGNMTLDPEGLPDYKSLARFYGQAFGKLASRLNVECPQELVSYVKNE